MHRGTSQKTANAKFGIATVEYARLLILSLEKNVNLHFNSNLITASLTHTVASTQLKICDYLAQTTIGWKPSKNLEPKR